MPLDAPYFRCQHCDTEVDRGQFNKLEVTATPVVKGATVQQVTVTCPNKKCGRKSIFIRDGRDTKGGKLYPEMFFEEDLTPDEAQSVFEMCAREYEIGDFGSEEPPFDEFSPDFDEIPSPFEDSELVDLVQENDTVKSMTPPPAKQAKKIPPPPPRDRSAKVSPDPPKVQTARKHQEAPQKPAPKLFECNDVDNGKRLAHHFGHKIQYAKDAKLWYVWNKSRWRIDTDRIYVERLAKTASEMIKKEAELVEDEKEKDKYLKWANTSLNLNKINSMIKMARSIKGLSIESSFFDRNQSLLNLKNYTIDLKIGKDGFDHFQHRREDFNTKIIQFDYSPGARHDLWDAFLDRVMNGNHNLIKFIQRTVGYCLTGDVSEQCLFFLYGTGANGKSVFLEVIRNLLGPYACQADFETFLSGQKGVRNDLARLQGSRFVSGAEVDHGRKFAEGFLKRITGNDQIVARFLYQEFQEFRPTFKVFLAGNHKPQIQGTDHAIWRRIYLIPFKVRIPAEEQDKHLLDKLRQELPGILNWAIQGCLDWKKQGLNPPMEIQNAIKEYKAEMDPLEGFFEECCSRNPVEKISKDDLYIAYSSWCLSKNKTPASKKAFGSILIQRDIMDTKSGPVRYWAGIALKDDYNSLLETKVGDNEKNIVV